MCFRWTQVKWDVTELNCSVDAVLFPTDLRIDLYLQDGVLSVCLIASPNIEVCDVKEILK